VLIADQDPVSARLHAGLLEARGVEVRVARGCASASALLAAERFSAMVADVQLTDGCGAQLAAQLRAQPHGAPGVVVLTGSRAALAGLPGGLLAQARPVACLEKPLSAPRFVDCMLGALAVAAPAGLSSAPPVVTRAGARAVDRAGRLEELPFFALFGQLSRESVTGQLVVRRDRVKKIVAFHDGRAISVASNLLSDTLGRVMTRAGLISADQCARSLEQMQATGRPQGEVLLQLGYATAAQVEQGLAFQREAKLLELFGWESGEWRFVAHAAATERATELQLSGLEALYRGLLQTSDEPRLRRLLGPVDPLRPSVAPSALAQMEALEQGLAELLSECSTVESLLASRPDRRVLLLASLLALRTLELCTFDPPTTGRARGEADERMVRRLEERIVRLTLATPYEVLGLERVARAAAVEEAFEAAALALHPETVAAGRTSALRDAAERHFDLYLAAYDTLRDSRQRDAWDAAHPETAAERAQRLSEAGALFDQAVEAFHDRRLSEADRLLTRASALWPESPLYAAWHARVHAVRRATPEAMATALSVLEALAQAHPELPEPRLFARQLRDAPGRDEAAE